LQLPLQEWRFDFLQTQQFFCFRPLLGTRFCKEVDKSGYKYIHTQGLIFKLINNLQIRKSIDTMNIPYCFELQPGYFISLKYLSHVKSSKNMTGFAKR